jgi:hypothetical protein
MALANEQFSLFHGMDNLASYALRDLKESQHVPKNISEKSLYGFRYVHSLTRPA